MRKGNEFALNRKRKNYGMEKRRREGRGDGEGKREGGEIAREERWGGADGRKLTNRLRCDIHNQPFLIGIEGNESSLNQKKKKRKIMGQRCGEGRGDREGKRGEGEDGRNLQFERNRLRCDMHNQPFLIDEGSLK